MNALNRIGWGTLWVCVVLLSGCGGAKSTRPAMEKLPIHMVVADTVNPDMNGRASPVVLRLYQLRAASAFQEADFFPLYDQEQPTLGAELIRREEFTLRPGEDRELALELDVETRYIGVAVAFRDIDQSQWRSLVEVVKKKTGLAEKLTFTKKNRILDISMERLAVQARLAEK